MKRFLLAIVLTTSCATTSAEDFYSFVTVATAKVGSRDTVALADAFLTAPLCTAEIRGKPDLVTVESTTKISAVLTGSFVMGDTLVLFCQLNPAKNPRAGAPSPEPTSRQSLQVYPMTKLP